MPPKSKFSEEEIVSAALALVEREGMQSLTARSLAAELGSSPRPIFTVFNSMEEVQQKVVQVAKKIYSEGVEEGLKETPAFKGVGKAYIAFAVAHPKFFQLLFMREAIAVPDLKNVLVQIEDGYEKILYSIKNGYGLNDKRTLDLYLHMWIYSHGIAVLIATGVCSFSSEEISRMLTEVCASLIKTYKAEDSHDSGAKNL